MKEVRSEFLAKLRAITPESEETKKQIDECKSLVQQVSKIVESLSSCNAIHKRFALSMLLPIKKAKWHIVIFSPSPASAASNAHFSESTFSICGIDVGMGSYEYQSRLPSRALCKHCYQLPGITRSVETYSPRRCEKHPPSRQASPPLENLFALWHHLLILCFTWFMFGFHFIPSFDFMIPYNHFA